MATTPVVNFGVYGNFLYTDSTQVMNGVSAISAGGRHTLILKQNGTLFEMGGFASL